MDFVTQALSSVELVLMAKIALALLIVHHAIALAEYAGIQAVRFSAFVQSTVLPEIGQRISNARKAVSTWRGITGRRKRRPQAVPVPLTKATRPPQSRTIASQR